MKRSAAALSFLALLAASQVQAATIRVTPTCTLAQAINTANEDRVFGGCRRVGQGADVILIQAGATVKVTNHLPSIFTRIFIRGNASTIQRVIKDPDASRIFDIDHTGVLTLEGLVLTGGSAAFGGAIYNSRGVLDIYRTVFQNNFAREEGGAIYNEGALYVDESAFIGNRSAHGSNAITSWNPFGIASLYVHNSTFSRNETEDAGFTPLQVLDTPDSTVEFSTFAFNGETRIGGWTNDRANIFEHGDESNNPNLFPLDYNGGLTPTHALRPGSTYIDEVTDGTCPPPEVDQRGVNRAVDGDGDGGPACDQGAYEVQAPVEEFCQGFRATIVGTDWHDYLIGTPGPDVIQALNGSDVIKGLRGDDIICASIGNDVVYAGDGADTVYGGTHNDRLFGEKGNDRLLAGDHNDSCNGGPGTDTASQCETRVAIP